MVRREAACFLKPGSGNASLTLSDAMFPPCAPNLPTQHAC